MLNWIDQYTILWKSIERLKNNSRGHFSHENSPIAPWNEFWKIFEVCTCVSACRAELIGILLVKIGWVVKKLFLGYLSQEVCLIALLAWNLEIHLIFNYFPCQSESIGMLLVKIGETVKKCFKRGLFGKICSLALLDWNFEKFRKFQFVPLGLLNRSCITYENW